MPFAAPPRSSCQRSLLIAVAAATAAARLRRPIAAPAAVAAVGAASPTPPVTDNPFIPPDKDLTECVSANPQPGCGSKAHGGWRQSLTFVVVALAMALHRLADHRDRAAQPQGRRGRASEEPEPSGRLTSSASAATS